MNMTSSRGITSAKCLASVFKLRQRALLILAQASVASAVACLAGCALQASIALAKPVAYESILTLAQDPPDARVTYGKEASQFGELWLPPGKVQHPVVVLVHGGCWQAAYTLAHVRALASGIRGLGYAVWSIEYRRVGEAGGGWPNTFLDVGAAVDHLRILAKTYPLDLQNITAIGHSAGGHLALWAASRAALPAKSDLYVPQPLPLTSVVGLAAISNLTSYAAGSGDCNAATGQLFGGSPAQMPGRYRDGLPPLPEGVDLTLIHGAQDAIVPVAQSEALVQQDGGGNTTLTIVGDAGHFDVISTVTPAWRVLAAFLGAKNFSKALDGQTRGMYKQRSSNSGN